MTANNVLFEYVGETQSLGSQFHSGPWSDSPRGSLQSLEFGSRFYESNSAGQKVRGTTWGRNVKGMFFPMSIQ